ncbi:hypothetical protein JIN85_20705 [Luteolibacter pohnpeiensis]|uniref:Uncharacterized protein n=1 Tax=Luteolibacter pohnpeiensis TaxID=454153 RepID=A0A934VYF5_9BACT|nr:hypothetical protein [Luteolibacter pohnpeiensis]
MKNQSPTTPKDAASEVQPAVPKLTEAQRADIKLMWETVQMQGGSKRKASSDRAQEAAHRVFSSISLTGLTRVQVISLLGDPEKASDSLYNFPFYPAPKGELVYRFDTGSYGWQFNISFDQRGRVIKVKSLGIE